MKENIEYLNNLKRRLDDQQLNACCAPGNVIVSAGAGSGKTQVLATRFAWLVMTKKVPAEKILTLTFTKKAASEMYQRIYETLETLANHPATPEQEKNLALKALQDFSKTHIQTLDSYNAAVLKQCASRYGIRPDFSQGEDNLSGFALSYVMQHRDSSVIKNLIDEKNFGNLQKIAEIINDEIQTRTNLGSPEKYFEILCDVKEEGCEREWTKWYNELFSEIDRFLSMEGNYPKPSKTVAGSFKEIKLLKKFLETYPDDSQKIEESAFLAFQDFMKKFSFTIPGGAGSEPLKEIVYNIRHTTKTPGVVIPNLLRCIDVFLSYKKDKDYAALLDDYMVLVNNRKRNQGMLSFPDVSAMALRAFEEQEDLRTQEQNAYEKIMIDEFQDNNDMNRKLLFLLSSENGSSTEECEDGSRLLDGKLFFVGDDKQSIYKFRGADVSVFKALGEYLHTEPVNMVYNYRSSEELLNSFNQIFGGFLPDGTKISGADNEDFVFPETVTESELYAATLQKRQMARRNSILEKIKPDFMNAPVHFCLFNRQALEKASVQFEDFVKPYVQELQEMGWPCDFKNAFNYAVVSNIDQKCYFMAKEIRRRIDESEGKLSYKDFAILDKGRNDRNIMAKYLSYFGIPYNMDQEADIFKSCVVNDIYNLLRLCVYPKDMIALASFLCSPFAGLNENDIEALFIDPDFDFSKSDEESLGKVKEALSEEKYELYVKAREFFGNIRKMAGSQSLAKTISHLWYECGYRYETLWHKDFYLDSNLYDMLFELARQCDELGRSLSYFIDEMENLDDSDLDIQNLDYPKEVSDVVQIMTIHKSKGLEFPYVFVYKCDTASSGKGEENDDQITEESPFGLSGEVEKAMADAEFRRVFYVALTRAEKECYIVAANNSRNTNCLLMKLCRHYYSEMESPEYGMDEWTFKEGAPFDFISINPVDRNSLNQGRSEGDKATLKTKSAFIAKTGKLFESAETVTYESQLEENPFISPSSLEKEKDEILETVEAGNPVCADLDGLLAILAKKDFQANHFGTFAHSFLENYIKMMIKSSKTGKNEKLVLPASIFRKLWDYGRTEEENFSAEPAASLINVCFTMCRAFMDSTFGKDLLKAEKLESEYSFISNENEKFVTGSIDLCYKRPDGKVVVVDYKTDGEIHPDKYYSQLACYKNAVSQLFDADSKDIECWLYYLRYGQAVNVTEKISEVQLPQ